MTSRSVPLAPGPGRRVRPAPRRKRRTQEERSASTRAKLLDATIACLFDLGYARMTTTDVATRAGVSRGAQLHHFPTKAALVTTAVEHLFDRRIAEFRDAFATLPAEADRTTRAIDLLWSMFTGATFYAWLELAVAARTDPELHPHVAAISRRFSDNVERTFRELFAGRAEANPFFAVAPWITFAILEGLSLTRMLDAERPEIPRVLEALKLLGRLVLPSPIA